MVELNKSVKKRIVFVAAALVILIICTRQAYYAGNTELTLKPEKPSMDETTFGTESNPYMLSSEADFINLQEYSKENTCKGMYFKVNPDLKENEFYYSPDEDDEEGSEMGTIRYNLDLTNIIIDDKIYSWQGIGSNLNYPFMGSIDFQGLILRMDTNVFGFLGNNSKVDNVYIVGEINNKKNVSLYGADASVAAIAYMVYGTEEDTSVKISNVYVSDTVKIEGGKRSTAGVVGMVYANANGLDVTLENCYVSGDISATGRIDGNYARQMSAAYVQYNFPGHMGGLIGDISSLNGNSKYIYVHLKGYNQVWSSLVNNDGGVGSLIGHMQDKVMVEIDGTVDLKGMKGIKGKYANYYKGYLIGSEALSISYATDAANIIMPENTDVTKNVASIDINGTNPDSYCAGMIYKGLEHALEDDGLKGTGTEADPYIIEDVNDMVIISTVLCSEGYFNLEKFKFPTEELNQATTISPRLLYLRSAHYIVINDIDLSERNILRLNRHGGGTFYGSFEGVQKADGTYPVITFNTTEYQPCIALFAYTGSAEGVSQVTFKNFRMSGSISGRERISPLIYRVYQASNNSKVVTSDYLFENIHIGVDIIQNLNTTSYCGGFIGLIDMSALYKDVPEFSFKNISYTGNMSSIGTNSYMGGIIGYVNSNRATNGEHMVFNISDYAYSGTFTSNNKGNVVVHYGAVISNITWYNYITQNVLGYNRNLTTGKTEINMNNILFHDSEINYKDAYTCEAGGLLGHSWSMVNVSINNMKAENVLINSGNTYCGGLLDSFSGLMDIDGLIMENFNIIRNINNNTSVNCALMFRWFATGVMNISNLDIKDTCGIKTYSDRTAEIISQSVTWINNTEQIGSIISINGVDSQGVKYSAYNGYKVAGKYLNASNGAERNIYGNDRLHYNVFENVSDGFIKGTGTKDNPIIIDSREKMMILYCINFANYQVKDYFLKYFGDIENVTTETNIAKKNAAMITSILDGCVVYADDMILADADYGYSYYAMPVSGGRYYGFNAKKYYADNGNISPTDEQVSTICAKAVNVLDSGKSYGGMTLEQCNAYKPQIHMDSERINETVANKTGNLIYMNRTQQYTNIGIKNLYSSLYTNIYNKDAGFYNLNLSGNYYYAAWNNDPRGGALVGTAFVPYGYDYCPINAGSELEIKYIDIGNLKVESRVGTNSNSNYGVGLLIDYIYTSRIEFDYIKILEGCSVKADALIGKQESSAAVNSKTIFRHMDLNEALDTDDLNTTTEKEGFYSKDGGTRGLKYGIFLYYLHSGTSIYWYDEGEDGKAPDVMTPGVKDANGLRTIPNDNMVTADENNVTPKRYAYKLVPVDVNPVISNITEGNGTKDDPFIIEEPGQLVTLGLCLKTEGEDTPADSWYVGNIADYPGYDEEDSSTWEHNSNYMMRSDAVDYLRTAYYKLKNDIDFTSVTKKNLINSIKNFSGIGTQTVPFSGNFDGNDCTITLENFDGKKVYDYGLFQHAYGIYVKDLTIKMDENDYISAYNSEASRIGFVAAYVRGADNIIDNVKIDATVKVDSWNVASCAGAYFGRMDYGSLTLIGINEDTFKNFKVVYGNKNTLVRSYIESNNNTSYSKNINGIIGMVVGSTYIVYSDDTAGNNPNQLDASKQIIYATDEASINSGSVSEPITIPEIKYQNNYGLRALYNKDIINENYLQSAGKIVISKNPAGGYYVDLANEKQMYILSLGIASGSLSASPVQNSIYWPYCRKAKTWKSEKSWIGPALSETDYEVNYPAILQYFDLTALENGYKDLIKGGYMVLNGNCTPDTVNNLNYRTTYRLNKNGYYDMSKIEQFKGISDNIANDNYQCMAFRSNFDGNGSTINLNIDNTSRITSGYAGLIPKAGFYQNQGEGKEYIIKDFTITGNVKGSSNTGGLIGYKYHGRYAVNNVNLKDMEVTGAASTGGYCGYLHWADGQYVIINKDNNNHSTVENVKVKGTTTGGVVGYARNASINRLDAINTLVTSTNGHAGGIWGSKDQDSNGYINKVSIKESVVEMSGNDCGAGGILGCTRRNNGYTGIHDVVVDNVIIQASEGSRNPLLGKIVGKYYHNSGTGSEVGILKMNDFYTNKELDIYPTIGGHTTENPLIVKIYYNDFHELAYAEELYGIKRYAENEDETDVRYAELIDDQVFAQPTGEYDDDGNEIKKPIDLIPDNDRDDDFEIVKWSSDAGSIEQVINSVLDTLTNKTGKLNDLYNNNITVSVVPMMVEHGVAKENTGGEAAINIIKHNGRFEVSNNNKYDSFEKIDKDGNYTPGTYSLVKITYSITGGTYKETITIPFFVSNMINVDIYSRSIIGEEYSAEIMRNITNRSVLNVTKDSSYTIYTEYMYSGNRIEFEDEVYMNKVFRFDNKVAPVIPKGTKLTLIDVTEDKPHIYYYEVDSEKVEVLLTEFKDENGNSYAERDISRLSRLPAHNVVTTMYFNGRHFAKYNRGVEKYFIFVDCSNVAQSGNLTELESQIVPSIVDNSTINNPEIFYIRERCRTSLSTFNPRYIGFVQDKVSVSDSVVNKNIKLNISADIYNRATDKYWEKVYENDYNNSNKYLEVAVYLENSEGEKILFPSGTRVKLDEDSEFDAIKNTSNIYYFKDGTSDEGYPLLALREDTIKNINLTFDFSYAKMENLPSGDYRICFELVRASNKDFPMGEGTIDIIYSDVFRIVSSAEYGFRFDVEDITQLSYNKSTDGDEYTFKYNMLLNSTLPKSDLADKEVYVYYRFYKKDAVSGEYRPYESVAGIYPLLKMNGVQYITLDGNELQYKVENLSAENEPETKIPFELTFNKDMEPTNYKMAATVYVNGIEEANDYVVFNMSDIEIR